MTASGPKKIGILGGGQLARMLVQEGAKMGLEMHVLSASMSDPAAQVTGHWHRGDVDDPEVVSRFARSVDALTFESEFISAKILQELSGQTWARPSPTLLAEFSDRLTQKVWLERYRIPTSRFTELQTKSDIYGFINSQKAATTNAGAVVMKKRRFGYDGYGTYVLRNKSKVASWMRKHATEISAFISEDFVKFRRELAFQVAMTSQGEGLVFPLVEWRAENSKCLWVKGPVRAAGFAPLAKKVVRALKDSGYVGLFAVELFETSKGLIVNEIAPRVHNSGHYTLEASPINQFNAHLRAVAEWPLPNKVSLNAPGFAMLNLLGTRKAPCTGSDVSLHWYGKNESRPGRKMGHLTALASTPDRALQMVLRAGGKKN